MSSEFSSLAPDPFELYDWVEAGDIERIRFLLNRDLIDVDISIGEDGCTPLMLAAFHGHLELVRLLVEFGANVNALTMDNNFALQNALQGGALDIAHYLYPLTDPDTAEWLREEYPDEFSEIEEEYGI